jgi:hypothetical protein
MILNHKTAIELLVTNIDTVGFDRFTLMNLHSALAENLLPNPAPLQAGNQPDLQGRRIKNRRARGTMQ